MAVSSRDYPFAYHLADAENWPSIQRDGLFSAEALIRRAGLSGKRAEPYRRYRPESMQLPSGVWIRDQRPMPPAALTRCLDPGLDPDAWYALVNAKVFFWLSIERLERQRAACGRRPQVMVVIDLPALLERHGDRASVTPFNVGNAKRRAASRGRRTFVPFASWRATRWASESRPGGPIRAPSHPPAELTVDDAIADVMEFVVDVRTRAGARRA
ncbi:MAG TPA: hypothetical protein VFA43_26230 [Gemmatimonadaceae bacterium]|nr:hypothetical protein [Gemmatimonadaceae bacterium]